MKHRRRTVAAAILLLVASCAHNQTEPPNRSAQHVLPPMREARVAARRQASRWAADLTFAEFREATRGYVPRVDRTNLVTIESQKGDWADYIAKVHKNVHVQFATGFLGTLPSFGSLGNPNLVTTVEIVIRGDGSLEQLGIIRSSGDEFYDYGVFSVIRQSAPYLSPPISIRSPDSLTYMHWALHRNESQCGTWNCEPFILRSAPQEPARARIASP